MRTLTVVDALDLAAAYAGACYGAQVDDRTIDLRIGEPATELESRWPATSYAFITAWNPSSDPRPEEANQAADAALVARLDTLGAARRPAWAESPEGQWRERGWLLANVEDGAVNELGIEFGQAAILAWNAGEPVTVRMLVSDPRPQRVPATGARLPAELAACIQWLGGGRETALNA